MYKKCDHMSCIIQLCIYVYIIVIKYNLKNHDIPLNKSQEREINVSLNMYVGIWLGGRDYM